MSGLNKTDQFGPDVQSGDDDERELCMLADQRVEHMASEVEKNDALQDIERRLDNEWSDLYE